MTTLSTANTICYAMNVSVDSFIEIFKKAHEFCKNENTSCEDRERVVKMADELIKKLDSIFLN